MSTSDPIVETNMLPCRTCGAVAFLHKRQGTIGPLYYVRCASDLHGDLYKATVEQAILDWNTWAREDRGDETAGEG